MADMKDQKLNDQELRETSGGYIFYNTDFRPNGGANTPWEVIDKKGNVVCKTYDKETAEKIDKAFRYSNIMGKTRELTWQELNKLRETGSPD